jgi:hypothetical protein
MTQQLHMIQPIEVNILMSETKVYGEVKVKEK